MKTEIDLMVDSEGFWYWQHHRSSVEKKCLPTPNPLPTEHLLNAISALFPNSSINRQDTKGERVSQSAYHCDLCC